MGEVFQWHLNSDLWKHYMIFLKCFSVSFFNVENTGLLPIRKRNIWVRQNPGPFRNITCCLLISPINIHLTIKSISGIKACWKKYSSEKKYYFLFCLAGSVSTLTSVRFASGYIRNQLCPAPDCILQVLFEQKGNRFLRK